MSNSSLATERYPAHKNNYTSGRNTKISEITIHHMSGVLSAKDCGAIFQNPSRAASSNYGIGKNGEIAVYVDEKDTSWCNSNWKSNCRAVTIETSNSKSGGNWPVSDKVLNQLIKLVADIAKRNGLGKLVKGKNLTWHQMYSDTDCPGQYLLSKIDYIVSEVNKIIEVSSIVNPAPTPSKGKFEIGANVVINGNLYFSSDATKPSGSVKNKTTKITRYKSGAKHPYNTTGDLGWMDESDIKLESNTSSAPASTFDLLTAVKKTIRGDYGNDKARKDALGSHYNEVQKQVELNIKHGTMQWYNIKLY